MKKYIVSVLFVSLLLVSGIVYAEEEQKEPALGGNPGLMNQQQKGKFEEIKKESEQEREKIKSEMEKAREEFKTMLATKREEMKTKFAQNRETLRVKLQTIKNETKQNTVLKISDSIETINEKATDRLGVLVDNIEKVLENIQTRTDKFKDEGKDTTSIQTAIDNATKLIAEARTTISAQAEKTYPINVTTEVKLQATIKAVRDVVHTDIKAVQEKVRLAHEAVRTSAKALASVVSPTVPKEEGTEE